MQHYFAAAVAALTVVQACDARAGGAMIGKLSPAPLILSSPAPLIPQAHQRLKS